MIMRIKVPFLKILSIEFRKNRATAQEKAIFCVSLKWNTNLCLLFLFNV